MALLAWANVLLVAYSAAIVNGVGILRNVVVIHAKNTIIVNVVLLALSTGLGLLLNSNGWLGILPIVISFAETFFVLRRKTTVTQLKLLYFFLGILWAVFNMFIKNYVGTVFNFVSAAAYLYAPIKAYFLHKAAHK